MHTCFLLLCVLLTMVPQLLLAFAGFTGNDIARTDVYDS